jgi:photosystem II stability/assembly factor-like uncharacterized protein
VAAIALVGGAARANGAFPDEFSVHFPPGAPHRILVGANFGLLISEDDGATWRYSCEPYVTMGSSAALSPWSVFYYQVTADGAILADSVEVTRSTDVGCTWPASGGINSSETVADLFPDPNDATFVLAIVYVTGGSYIVASHDGGKNFDSTKLYTTPDLLKGIEISKTTPTVVYATQVATTGASPVLLKSTDRGQHWVSITLPASGQTEPRILAIDPEDPKTVYLRLFTGTTDSIVITRDGGQTFEAALTVPGAFTSFLRAGDGALHAGMIDGTLYVRAAGKTTFEKRTGPRLRCLGQRPGTSRIYACGDMFLDGFSFAKSDDGGVTFQKVMSFNELLGPLTCSTVQTSCAAHWERIQQVLAIGGTDAGQPGSGSADAGVAKPPSSGGHCASAGAETSALVLLLLLARGRRTGIRGATPRSPAKSGLR